MNKKNLRFYEAPMAEAVELNVEAHLLAGSVNPKENPFSDSTEETEEGE